MNEPRITDEAVEQASKVHLMEAEAHRLSMRLNDLATLKDHIKYAGDEPKEQIPKPMKRRDDLLQRLRDERHRKPPEPEINDPIQDALIAIDYRDRSAIFDRLDLCGGFSPWLELPTPATTEGISETPGVPGTYGEIGTGGLFLGGASYGGMPGDTGQHDPHQEKFWIHNWRCLIQFPPAPPHTTLSYRFGVSSEAHIYHAPVLSATVMAFVTVGTTKDINIPITNWTTVGWPVNATLPANFPHFYGDVLTSGEISVAPGKTAAVGLIFGAIAGVNQGYVQYTWGNFGTHKWLPPNSTLDHTAYGRIEYRFCPLRVLEWELDLRKYFQ